jgi:hypothetical protein
LHDNVQLALVESGFEDVARLREAFTREGRITSLAPAAASRGRRRRARVARSREEVPLRSTRNLAKKAAASSPTSIPQA